MSAETDNAPRVHLMKESVSMQA